MTVAVDAMAGRTGPRRRALLGGLGGVLTGQSLPFAARGNGAARVLKMGYIFSRNSQFGAGSGAFARRVEAATNGAYAIEQYPAGALGGEMEMLEGLRRGWLDLGLISIDVSTNVVPELGIFDMPFLFRDAAHAHAVLDGAIGQGYLDLARHRDLIALAWGEIGLRNFTNSKHPIRVPADLHGLRLRSSQSDVMLRCFRQLGAEAATLGFPAVYAALESGRFDGQDNPIATIRDAHFERVQHYLTLSKHIYSGAIIVVSRDCWDDLAPAERDIFTEAARDGGAVSRQTAALAERDGVGALQAAGMEIVWEIDRAAFLAATEPTWSELARRFGEKHIESIREYSA